MTLDRYASGIWLTRRLIAFGGWAGVLATAIGVAVLLGTAEKTVDAMGRPLGTDFTSFWSAGRLALDGRATSAYDWPVLFALQKQMHGVEQLYPWSYPPVFLLVVAGFSVLPYLPALVAWQVSTMVGALVAAWAALPSRLGIIVAIGCPSVFICLSHGQTGFLTAALFLGGLVALRRSEVWAGVLFGLMVYKPQLGLLIPIALASGGYWRAIAAATTTIMALVGLTIWIWGISIWQIFLTSLTVSQSLVLDEGGGHFERFQSAFAAVRLWGGAVAPAYAAQVIVFVGVAIANAQIWKQQAIDMRLKGAALLVGSLLATPYILDYDFILLGMTTVLLASHGLENGFRAWEKTLLAAAWIIPASSRFIAKTTLLPIGFLFMVALFLFICETVRRACGAPDARASDPKVDLHFSD